MNSALRVIIRASLVSTLSASLAWAVETEQGKAVQNGKETTTKKASQAATPANAEASKSKGDASQAKSAGSKESQPTSPTEKPDSDAFDKAANLFNDNPANGYRIIRNGALDDEAAARGFEEGGFNVPRPSSFTYKAERHSAEKIKARVNAADINARIILEGGMPNPMIRR